MEQLMFLPEKVSDAAAKMAISRAPASSAASSPLAFGTSTGKETPLWRATAFKTLAVSAICGAHLGETKLPASMDVSPAAISFSMKAMRVSTESATASFCKPSRGPTSTMRTRSATS